MWRDCQCERRHIADAAFAKAIDGLRQRQRVMNAINARRVGPERRGGDVDGHLILKDNRFTFDDGSVFPATWKHGQSITGAARSD